MRDWDPYAASVLIGCMLAIQIRELSIKQITSPIVYDNLKNPVAGGLYDPAMGPLEQSGRYAARPFELPARQTNVLLHQLCIKHWSKYRATQMSQRLLPGIELRTSLDWGLR